jgi:hypothetical protein
LLSDESFKVEETSSEATKPIDRRGVPPDRGLQGRGAHGAFAWRN